MALKIPILKRLRGQEENQTGGFLDRFKGLSGISGIGLRRSWIVIVGEDAPEGEIIAAQELARYLRRTLNISVGAFMPIRANMAGLRFLTQLANVICIGGPAANEYTFMLNDLCNPKYDFITSRDKSPDETWVDYIKSGALTMKGLMMDDVPYPYAGGVGIIGAGRQRALDTVLLFGGYNFEDTCAMIKAFEEGGEVGIYDCTYTTVPDMSACPSDVNYSFRIGPTI
jgi:hypothetical protein